MLKRYFFPVALVLVSHSLSAQITIAGAKSDLGTGTISVIRWNANTGNLLDSVPTPGDFTLRSQLADGSWTQGKFIKL
jgi:hypothetical protein